MGQPVEDGTCEEYQKTKPFIIYVLFHFSYIYIGDHDISKTGDSNINQNPKNFKDLIWRYTKFHTSLNYET